MGALLVLAVTAAVVKNDITSSGTRSVSRELLFTLSTLSLSGLSACLITAVFSAVLFLLVVPEALISIILTLKPFSILNLLIFHSAHYQKRKRKNKTNKQKN